MPDWLQVLVTGLITLAGSSGFWAYMQRRDATRAATDRLLRGMAYDKIVSLGMEYIARGWLTQDEYEEFRHYLYDPYKAMGGNGVTERIMAEVTSLPLRPRALYSQMIEQAKTRRSERDIPSDDAERAAA